MAFTRELANYVADLRYENIPEDAVNLAKMILSDFLGVAIAGRDEEGPLLLKEFILEQGCAAESGVPGYSFKTSAVYSALLCGMMGHVLDYDDVAYSMSGHSAVVLAPVIWALGDKYNITGKQAIEAFLAGFEGASTVGRFMKPDKPNPGIWHQTKTIGVIGATLTAAKIMDLTRDQIRVALGIAASMSGGLMRNFGTMMKPFHAGSAAHDGILAAAMAKKGFTAHMDILEAETGFRRAFLREGGPSEESMVNSLHSGLWDITSGGGVTIKLFPSCGGTHKAISAVIGLANREDIKPADVKSVVIKNQEWVFKVAHITEPKTGLEGKFSVEFTVAVALTYRAVGMEHFTDAKVKELEPLMKKISREVDTAPAEGPHVPTTATITMADGRVFANTVNYQTGHAENPLTWEELFRKYRGCMALHFPEEEIAKSWEMLTGLERVERFRDLIAVFTK